MKRYITSIAVLSVLLFISCACDKNSGDSGKDDVDVEFTATGWNGYFAEALAKAYDEFSETGDIPATVNVEGLKYNRGRYLAAGIQILRKIIAEPDTWQDEDVTYIIASGPDSYANNTFNDDVMTFDAFMDVLDIAYEYAGERNVFPNYCTTETEHKDPDGSVYSVKMTINTIYVMMTRVFAYFVENNSLPEEISTWDADYLHETLNCEVSDPLVVSAMETATEGLVSDYDRAKAIFEYARDEWEWLNYNNTSKGAVGTIQDKGGNCCDLTHAIVAMSRAVGIPARYRHAQCQYASGVIGHVIAEIYVDGVWYLADASNNENTFGNHEAWSHMATFNGRYNELPF